MNEYNYYADFYLVRAIQNTFVSHISIISKILFNMIIELGKKNCIFRSHVIFNCF